MKICIVEDDHFKNFYPLTKTRPVFDLKCGKYSLEERIRKVLKPAEKDLNYIVRPELESVWKSRIGAKGNARFGIPKNQDCLVLNGRVLFDSHSLKEIYSRVHESRSFIWLTDERWAAIYIPREYTEIGVEEIRTNDFDLSLFRNQMLLNVATLNYPWDLVNHNSAMIRSDYKMICESLDGLRFPPLPSMIAIVGEKNITIGKNAEIHPFVTLDCSRGPIIIGDNVTVESGAFIKGPVSIGDNCLVSANTKIYDNTTLGNTCKVGGEISHSILHGFSNKRHSGFLGNSYIGEWVNLGAGTNNSNLKNNYNKITVSRNGDDINTGSQFIGLFMGDHSRSAIATKFNTATFVGVGCNVFGDGFPPKHVEDFSWGGSENSGLYNFEKFIESAKRMMIRREKELSDEEVRLLQSLHDQRKMKEHNTNGIHEHLAEE